MPFFNPVVEDSAGDDLVVKDLLNADLSADAAADGASTKDQPAAAKKTPKRAPSKKQAAKEKDSGADGGDANEPATPSAAAKPAKKRTPAKKKVTADSDDVDPGSATAPASAKKRASPKKKDPVAVADGEEAGADGQATPTPAKKKRQYKKKDVVAAAAEGEDGEGTPAETPTKKAPKPKAKPKPKATPKSKVKGETGDYEAGDQDAGPVTPGPKSPKKRKAAEAGDETPNGKRSKTFVKIGATYEELFPEDKLIVDMKAENKTNDEINAAYEELTGRRPSADYVRKRWPKLQAVSVKLSDDEIRALLAAKLEVDKSYWAGVADKMKGAGITLSAKVLETKYKWLVDNGKIDAKGCYIAPVVDSPPATSPLVKPTQLNDDVEGAELAQTDVEAEFQNGDMPGFGADEEALDV